jgi:hypothetical protein
MQGLFFALLYTDFIYTLLDDNILRIKLCRMF